MNLKDVEGMAVANFDVPCQNLVRRDGVVGIATRYVLDDPGIEARWGRDFPCPFRPAPSHTQPHVKWVTGFFPRGKAAGAWRIIHPT